MQQVAIGLSVGMGVTYIDEPQLERVAVEKWGSMEAVEAEKARRIEKREKRALESPAKSSGKGESSLVFSLVLDIATYLEWNSM